MKLRKTLTVLILIIMFCVLLQGSVQAALQSVPKGTTKRDTATNWVINVRKMENAGGGMGLKETTNETSGLAESQSNNIDVHLLKSTEYGAIVLLGASDYGKQGTSIDARRMDQGATTGNDVQASTTGNKYGIYELGYENMQADTKNAYYEWVAGGLSTFLPNIAPRYVDIYTTDKVGKPGDATIEGSVDFSNWHTSSPLSNWVTSSNPGFNRGYVNYGVFSRSFSTASSSYGARASVVCGVGL